MENATGMVSAEGEVMPLRNYQARVGEVEEWLKTLEEQMKYSLKVVIRNSLIKYEQEDTLRKKWVLEYPLQVITTLDCIFWTKTTEENYLSKSSESDLDEWLDTNIQMLEEIS